MILYPAIDLKDGQCVRLRQGLMDQATVFNENPADQARQFTEQGFSALHVVDLNGAFEGRSVNADAVSAILSAVSIPVQLGGGIRTLEAISLWLSRGVSRVILGTAAVRNPSLVKAACARFRARSPLASMPRMAGSRFKDGRRPRSFTRPILHAACRMSGLRRSSTPTSPATEC